MQLSSPQVCCIVSCAQPWNDKNGNNYVYLNLIGARKFLRGSSTGPSFVPEVTRPFSLFLGWGLGTRLETNKLSRKKMSQQKTGADLEIYEWWGRVIFAREATLPRTISANAHIAYKPQVTSRCKYISAIGSAGDTLAL